MREEEGKSYAEISRATDCLIGTVRSRIFRAREEILNFFEDEIRNG
jgi:RNA polymerase sigma-70 factor (ECF subfamily)